MLRIVDNISEPGNPARPNDDRMGGTGDCVFVIDGATGLGDVPVIDRTGSDAAWLAEQARRRFERDVTPEADLTALLETFSRDMRSAFEKAAQGTVVPRYAWPSAGFAMLRRTPGGFEFCGLGDCALFLCRHDRTVERYTALPDYHVHEQQAARRFIEKAGGFGRIASFMRQPETLAALRATREAQNTPESGIWTLGLVPEAVRHLVRVPLVNPPAPAGRPTEPLRGPLSGIVCTDGFADLVDLYRRYTPATLVAAARERGLASLVEELRRIERHGDPDGLAYPRFKQSDDATAVLFEIG